MEDSHCFPNDKMYNMGMKSKKDTTGIPNGSYCYGKLIRAQKTYPFARTYKQCPYSVMKKIAGVSVCWCDYMDKGGLPNDLEDKDFAKLVAHFGGEDETFRALPLTLLFDSVKECGVNEEYDRVECI